ncbi:hypothetical protein ASE85_07790 [Sphingobium sp. Leaf26]|uniref:hypothetical protein n=1 Tax=Sphingobium sp. Leaf26 TaxID=1735693 RepID=UPI0006FEFECF|nr:hypothetical protein [Sphingobium sp. Leaf26]KQN04878.1 hypothetical protein ASE85_07790 [Sphingobium sp. Leaf26]
MVNIVYLLPGEAMPDHGDDMRWLIIEESDDRQFFGTGGSFKANGDWVGYVSLAENDGSLEAALAAAQNWAAKYDVPTIWVQIKPPGS